LEIKVLFCALVLMLYCVLVRSVRYCWSTCISLDEILHKHVHWQPHKRYWISRSWVKVQGH